MLKLQGYAKENQQLQSPVQRFHMVVYLISTLSHYLKIDQYRTLKLLTNWKDGNGRMNERYTYMSCPTFNKKCDNFSVNTCIEINEVGV